MQYYELVSLRRLVLTSASRMEPVASDAKALLRQSSISRTLSPSSTAILDTVDPNDGYRRIVVSAGKRPYRHVVGNCVILIT